MADEPPDESPDASTGFLAVFATGDPGLIALARSLLDAEGVEYFVRGDALQDLFGLGRLGTGYNVIVGPAELIVRHGDVARARELLEPLSGPIEP